MIRYSLTVLMIFLRLSTINTFHFKTKRNSPPKDEEFLRGTTFVPLARHSCAFNGADRDRLPSLRALTGPARKRTAFPFFPAAFSPWQTVSVGISIGNALFVIAFYDQRCARLFPKKEYNILLRKMQEGKEKNSQFAIRNLNAQCIMHKSFSKTLPY